MNFKYHRAKPYIPEDTKDSILSKYRDILDTGGLIQGKYVLEFEEEVKLLSNVDNAIATTSCGTGLETVLIASEIRNKKFSGKIIKTPFLKSNCLTLNYE